MRDAARIKGVSYSRTLRAIRSGRLPSIRVGRMLLVAVDDLDAWDPSGTSGAWVASATDVASASRETTGEAALRSRLEWLAAVREPGAAPPTLDAVGERFVADLGVGRFAVWTLDRRNQRLVRLFTTSRRHGEAVDTIALRDAGAALTMLRPGLQSLDGRLTPVLALRGDRWNLIAPVRAERQLLGLVSVAGSRGQAPFSDEALRWANLLVTFVSDDLVARHRAAGERQRTEQLQALIDSLIGPAAIVDETGRTLVANRSLRVRFGLQPDSLAIGVDLPTLLGQAEHLIGGGGKRSVVPRLRAALAGRETTTLPLLTTPTAGQGTTRLVVTPVAGEGDADERGVASLVRLESMARPERPPEPEPEPEPERGPASVAPGELVEIGRLVDLVAALGVGAHLDDVLIAAVDALRGMFEASAGSILLRREDGMLVQLMPSGFDPTLPPRTVVDPETLPSTRRAISERRTAVVRRATGNAAEIEALDRAHSGGGLIIPLLLGEDVIGLAVLALATEPAGVTAEQLALATGLGRYLAAAVTNARNWDRWGVAQRHLLTVIDQLPQGVIVVDATDGSLAVANRAADELWGMDLRGTADTDDVSALGDVVREVAAPAVGVGGVAVHDAEGAPFPAGESPMERTLRLGERRLGEPLMIIRSDGSVVRVVGNHVPIIADDGRTVSAVGVFQDIEQLREVDRAKDEFLSVVAHELRNPLTSLRGNLQLVQRRLRRQEHPTRDEDIDRLEGLIAQTDRINDLVGRLLDVSRADLDRIALEHGEVDATELVANAVEAARGLATAHTIALAAPASLPVVWDRLRVEQVIGNLLSNAIKYTDGGEIRVTLALTATGEVEISVADQGDGIPEAVQPRIFERYYRGTQGPSGPDGLGIGLYISARIVAAHHGTLTVGDAPGGGAVFSVRLPVDARTASHQQTG